MLLDGEAGIGKTRLAEELVARVREPGAAVLGGRAYEEEAALAYGPLVEALRERLRDDDAWFAAVADRALCEAARLLPDLSGAPPPPLDGPGAQARFLDGVWETLAARRGRTGARRPRARRRAVGGRGDARAAQLRRRAG